MDYKYIEQLLERYWNCGTTLEEEQILRTFFSQKEVPASLAKYKALFCYGEAQKAADTLGDDFDARLEAIVEEPGSSAHAQSASAKGSFRCSRPLRWSPSSLRSATPHRWLSRAT